MTLVFIFVVSMLFIAILVWMDKKLQVAPRQNMCVLASFLLVAYLFRLYMTDAIDSTFNLLSFDIVTDIDAWETWLFSAGKSLFMIALRWFTVALIVWAAVGSYFKQRTSLYLLSTIGVIVGVLNIVFYPSHLVAFSGWDHLGVVSYRGIQFAIESMLFMTVMGFALYMVLKDRVLPSKRQVGVTLFVFAVSLIAVMPQALFYNLFGYFGHTPIDFSTLHVFIMLTPVALMFVMYFTLRKRQRDVKEMTLMFLVIAAILQFFYIPRTGVAGLPLHLCNTAVILMFVAFVFRKEGFFYFNYFANVIGAVAAIMMPNYNVNADVNSIGVMHFGFNHLYALIIPILAVALHIFPRPTLKHMYKAIVVFTVYFVLVVFLNAWFRNFHDSVDYFFTYSDHIPSIFGARKLQYDYSASFMYRGLTFTFFPLFQSVYFIAFIFLMFMSWYIYDGIYQAFDKHDALILKQKMMRKETLDLKRRLDGRSITEPINPGGTDMISIRNFSKRYGNTKEKSVENFSLDVHKGEVFGFLGHNGAGKSTTIKSLVGIQSITEGEIEVCGYSIKTQPLQAKLHIGYVSDNHAMYEKLTGREYVNYVADLYNVDETTREERLNYYLDRFSLAFAIDQEIKSYSHGMKQKLAVIASLIHDPEVWVLDEPLTGLDPTSAYQIKECMREHAEKGNIVFFSSHVIEVVEKICHRIAIINKGKLEGVYSLDDLRAKQIALEDLYMHNKRDLQ